MTSKRPKISFLLPSFAGGGAERVMIYLANRFFDIGLSVDFIVLNDSGPYGSHLQPGVHKIVLGGTSRFRLVRYALLIIRFIIYLRREEPERMISSLHEMNILNIFMNKFFNRHCRVIVREANSIEYLFKNPTIKNKLKFWLLRQLYPRADMIIVLSQVMKNDLQHRINGLSSVQTIYNPLSLRVQMERSIHHSRSPVIVACGRLTVGKNFKDLIHACRDLFIRYPDMIVYILGDGDEHASLQKLISECNLDAVVKLVGFVDNPADYFRIANVFVQTSLLEGFPNVLIEAMACGTPVVAYDSKGAMREILDNGQYGKLVPVGDIEQLGKAISEIIERPTSIELLGKALERYDPDRIAGEYLQALGISYE